MTVKKLLILVPDTLWNTKYMKNGNNDINYGEGAEREEREQAKYVPKHVQ